MAELKQKRVHTQHSQMATSTTAIPSFLYQIVKLHKLTISYCQQIYYYWKLLENGMTEDA
jgi:hypothetical protein